MTRISPMLGNTLTNNRTAKHSEYSQPYDIMYDDIASRANEVAPNAAKARIVQNDPITYFANPIRDTFKDVKHYGKAVSKGVISDNNLGRINDLGMKAGAVLIATFLAAHAKTKTDTIMKFIGGLSFVGSMSLWPKIFINLPARIIHGFPIDQKYISAQGDKKDFYLDNGFIVWDAMKEEDKRKYAKRANIDYDAPRGKEKIERKMQKTALQNRTLNLLTVGIGAPVMTALFCNRAESFVKDAVINGQYKKTKEFFSKDFEKQLDKLEPEIKNQKTLQNLITQYADKELDEDFFKAVSDIFKIADEADYKDSDNLKIIKQFHTYQVDERLKELANKTTKINFEDFRTKLLEAEFGVRTKTKLDEETVDKFMAALHNDLSLENIKATLTKNLNGESAKEKLTLKSKFVSEAAIEKIYGTVKQDKTKFFEAITKYNSETLPQLRARAKEYIDRVNSVFGSKTESVYTRGFEKRMQNMFKVFGFKYKGKQGETSLAALKDGTDKECMDMISKFFSSQVKDMEYNSDEYIKFIQKFKVQEKDSKKLDELTNILKDVKKMKAINPDKEDTYGLTEAILGGRTGSANLYDLISGFINEKTIDMQTIGAQPVICANVEMRLKNGQIQEALKQKGLVTDAAGASMDELVQVVRELVYKGTSAYRNNNGFVLNAAYAKNSAFVSKIIDIIYDKEAFSREETVIKGIQQTVERIRTFKGNSAEKYFTAGNFTKFVKNAATRLFNDKSWMKIFAPIAIILVAGTLLIQPFFGKIDKEFQENKEERSAK